MPSVEDKFNELEEKLDLNEERLMRVEPILERSNQELQKILQHMQIQERFRGLCPQESI